jgi:hypothetical protein
LKKSEWPDRILLNIVGVEGQRPGRRALEAWGPRLLRIVIERLRSFFLFFGRVSPPVTSLTKSGDRDHRGSRGYLTKLRLGAEREP